MVGLVIGIFLGIVITTLDSSDFDRNGKSLRDDIKDFVFGLVDGGNGGRLMQKTMSTASRGKLMWGIVLVMSMILGGLSVFCIIGNSQNPNSEFNTKRTRDKWEKF